MARYIAFDWGKARTGIAVTDSNAIIASPHSTVPTSDLMDAVKKLFNEEACSGFVVGVPGLIIGSTTDSSAGIEAFISQLEKAYPGLNIHRVDENHTSSQALDALISGGMKKSERCQKGSLDKVSAALILQRFLG